MLRDAAVFLSYPEAVAALKQGLAGQAGPRSLATGRPERTAGQPDGDWSPCRGENRQGRQVPWSPSGVSVLLPATVDGACAAAILAGAVARYLGQELA